MGIFFGSVQVMMGIFFVWLSNRTICVASRALLCGCIAYPGVVLTERRTRVWVLIAAHSFRASNDHRFKSAVGSEDANAAERGGSQYVDWHTPWSYFSLK
jgi:hypothetical protein